MWKMVLPVEELQQPIDDDCTAAFCLPTGLDADLKGGFPSEKICNI